jgi:hypothetical protein
LIVVIDEKRRSLFVAWKEIKMEPSANNVAAMVAKAEITSACTPHTTARSGTGVEGAGQKAGGQIHCDLIHSIKPKK